MTTRRRHRALTPEELALWRHVTQDVARSAGRAARPADPVPATPEPTPGKPASKQQERRYEVAGYTPPVSAPQARLQPPLGSIEGPVRRRLARGRLAIDAAIDLHGLRQDEAYRALRAFLVREQAAGARIVLVVTGKGFRGTGHGERHPERNAERNGERHGEAAPGVLKRHAPHWLSAPQWRRFVSGFDQAGRGHGGEGALYVRLRRLAGDPFEP